MKKTILLSAASLLLAVSCNEVKPDDAGETSSNELTVVIDRENGANGKATLDDTSGAFAWSRGDQIKVYDGTGIYTGTTQSTENYGLFSVEKPFNINNGSGWVVFPANIVTGITASSLSITLPTSYTFSQVGSDDPDDSKAPVPMIGTYTHNNKVTMKQVASVVRFRFSKGELGAGNISFTFGPNVTGAQTISSPNPGTSTITAPSITPGKTISVSISAAEWATVTGSYVYFTVPVPQGTTIDNSTNAVLVSYSSTSVNKLTSIKPATSKTLARAEGYKVSGAFTEEAPEFKFKVGESTYVVMAPGNLMAKISSYSYDSDAPAGGYAEADEWKFGEYMQFVGNATNAGNYLFANAGLAGSDNATALIGQWVDLFSFQGESATIKSHGLVNFCSNKADQASGTDVEKWHGHTTNEELYDKCWETNADNSANDDGYIQISNGNSYKWRPMTGDEWRYLMNSRDGSTVGTFPNARHGRVTIAGVKGLLIFPDGITWRTTAQGGSSDCGNDPLNADMTAIADARGVPTNLNIDGSNTYNFLISYTADDFVTMSQAGIVFLPSAGYRNGDEITQCGNYGYYWSSSSSSSDSRFAKYLIFNTNLVKGPYDYHRHRGRSVRLVRDVE